jgi:hypothetical protein
MFTNLAIPNGGLTLWVISGTNCTAKYYRFSTPFRCAKPSMKVEKKFRRNHGGSHIYGSSSQGDFFNPLVNVYIAMENHQL